MAGVDCIGMSCLSCLSFVKFSLFLSDVLQLLVLLKVLQTIGNAIWTIIIIIIMIMIIGGLTFGFITIAVALTAIRMVSAALISLLPRTALVSCMLPLEV